ncbi:hypothetical protein CRE_26571 [Caenorhabditis remanei]|uniref:Sugar phosphate transporter domain-containing protein n=1 Tax=Caenorhabditis remanei TaxID=31234 RepID=E3LRC2_CAERE|nr:hypothetical protein CRE_26571 [Caenorhabditis remanei]
MVAFAVIISVMMVITGSLNTICAKWADSIKAEGVPFNHPFLQATCMFFGEFLCLVVFFLIFGYKRYVWNRSNVQGESGSITEITTEEKPILPPFNPFLFFPPALCDILGTSIMYIGLNLTTASSFQMLRGAVIIFTGLLSVGMLNAQIKPFKWFGMLFVMLGLVIVGVTDIYYDSNPLDDKNYEQKYLTKYDVPALFAVGLEGLFGMVTLSLLMVPFYYIHVPKTFSTNPEGRLEDVFYAWQEIKEEPTIALALLGTVISIAFFNFAGVSVTKELSATTRMVLDSIRTLVIWVVSIPLFGEQFIAIQLSGFAMLILGTLIYNDVLIGPWFRRNILPNLSSHANCARCWLCICGGDSELIEYEQEDQEHLIEA